MNVGEIDLVVCITCVVLTWIGVAVVALFGRRWADGYLAALVWVHTMRDLEMRAGSPKNLTDAALERQLRIVERP